MLFVAVVLLLHIYLNDALEIEHPHSFSVFKRGVMLGDVSYSYSSTDMGSPESGRYKTVTVIKNIAVPKPTSTMFSDRSEHYYDTIDKSPIITGNEQKKRTHVEYWPPREDNQVSQKHTLQKPDLERYKLSSDNVQHRPHAEYHRSPPRQLVVMTKTSHTPPAATMEHLQEDPKHPIDLLELAKSAVETLNQKAKIGSTNTGPVTFPADAMMKKKVNGIVSVAKEYTSVLTTDPKDRPQPMPIASKLRTKVDAPTKSPPLQPTYTSSSEEIPLKEFEQSEYVFNHRTGSFEFKTASKAPKAVQEYLRIRPQVEYKVKQPMSSTDNESSMDGTQTYTSPKELLFAELQNAVASRNVSMIKSLAGQLEETFNIGKFDFESLKMGEMVRQATEEAPITETTTGRSPFDFGYGPETTTMDYQEAASEPAVASTTIKSPTTTTATTTKKPIRYIAPKLRGFKRFSSKRQNN